MILISWDHLGYAGIRQPQSPPSAVVTGPPGSWQLDLRFFFIRIQAGSQPANKLVKMVVESRNVSGTESGGEQIHEGDVDRWDTTWRIHTVSD